MSLSLLAMALGHSRSSGGCYARSPPCTAPGGPHVPPPSLRRTLPLLLVILGVLLPERAALALTINDTSCTQQSGNVLRYDCSVETDTSATVEVRFCDATVGGTGCTKSRSSEQVTGTSSTTCSVGSSCTLTA